MQETGLAVQEQPKNTFPAIIVSHDAQLALWLESTTAGVEAALEDATALEIKDDATMQVAVELKREYKQGEKDVTAKIKPYKDRLNKVKDQVLDVEKALATNGYKRAADIVMDKINVYLDKKEQERKAEEKRLNEIAEADRKKRLDKVGKDLDKLLDKVSDLNEQKAKLEARIEDQSITVEEAEIIRERINAIETKLGQATQRVETKQVQMEEVAAPSTVVVNNVEKPKGLSTSVIWEPQTITNPYAVLQEIIDRKLPIAVVNFNMAKIKQAANDQVRGTNMAPSIKGVQFVAKRDTRIR